MTKKLLILTLVVFTFNSCVSSKLYKELEGKYTNLKNDYDSLNADSDSILSDKNALQNQYDQLQNEYDATLLERNQLQQDLTGLQKKHDALNDSYTALEQNSSKAIADNVQKNRELLAQLNAKELALAAENDRLLKLEADMQERSQRIAELETLIASKDQAMRDLKDAISKALTDFEGKGLTVEQRDGKVYVSMQNKLLFRSGQWQVGTEGKQALQQLAQVLAENPDIAVLIEGHTDNVPYQGKGPLEGNWDLSTKRATAVVNLLLKNSQVLPQNLTAAGRSEYLPIGPNSSSEGRAANRRIEVILSPNLDEISALLNTF